MGNGRVQLQVHKAGSWKRKGEEEVVLYKLKKIGSCLGTFTLKGHGRA